MSKQSLDDLRNEINLLISEAEVLLTERAAFYTDGNKLAIREMLAQAKLRLQLQEAPFTRNRSFYCPTDEEQLQFIIERYTMVPPFKQEGDVYTFYGLKHAINWFKQQDAMFGSVEQILARAKLAAQQSKELLHQAVIGEKAGQFPAEAVEKLQKELCQLQELQVSSASPSLEELALQTVACRNSLRACRHARILRSDVAPSCNLYVSNEQRPAILKAITNDPTIASYYKQIKLQTERYTLDYLEQVLHDISYQRANYEELNKRYSLWSSSGKVINFKAPIGTHYGRLSFTLPSVSNDADGLGHIWLKNISIQSSSKGDLPIDNGSFEDGDDLPNHWSFIVHKGEPEARLERSYPLNGSCDSATSARSVYLCNPTNEDEIALNYDKHIRLEAGEKYTLQFDTKIDGKLKSGLLVKIDYFSEQHQPIGQFSYSFNRKSSIAGGQFQLPMQCDAIQYWLSGDETYAHKVKYALLYIFNDFCQGAEHWLVTNLRPEGSDSYGAVQAGRLLSVAAVSYSLIVEANVFSEEEKNTFYRLVEYLLHYVLDLRDRTEWTAYEAQQGCSNWQTDMCAGAALMMMALRDFPNRLAWLYNAEAVLKAQLELNVNPDHSWPESIRYHVAALERFAGYAKVSQFITGQQWFTVDSVLPGMFKYLIDMQTPSYPYFNHTIGTPPFGDHALTAGAEYGSFPVYIHDIAALHPQLADEMYHTWVAAGSPMKKIWGEGILFENLISSLKDYSVQHPLSISTTLQYRHSGNYIFRYRDSEQHGHYFAIMSSPAKVAHGHLDQGTFILYYDGIPLIMDSGIEGYFDATTEWHISSYSHACVQFSTKEQVDWHDQPSTINLTAGTYSLARGWVDTPTSSTVKSASTTEDIDEILIEIDNPKGYGKHLRHALLLKQLGVTIISDAIIGFHENVLLNLPLAAKTVKRDDHTFHITTHSDVELDIFMLQPTESITLEQGRSTHFMEGDDTDCSYMTYIRVVSSAAHGFLTVLAPRTSDLEPIIVEQHQCNGYIISSNNISYWIRLDQHQLLATPITTYHEEGQ